MLIKTLDGTGAERWLPAADVLAHVHDPEPKVLFFDDFTELDIEDGQAPTQGARWADSFVGWGTRRLANAPNLDQGVKRAVIGEFIPSTHQIVRGQGLALRAFPDDDSDTGYSAGMISSERSFAIGPGHRFDMDLKVNAIGAGQHFTAWLMPPFGGGHPECDWFEIIGGQAWRPDGPINKVFMNFKDAETDNFSWHDVPDGFLGERHTYSLIWTEGSMTWQIDGQTVKTAANIYNDPLYMMFTWEIGASKDGDFPSSVSDASPWPSEVVLHSVRVTAV